MMDTILAVFTYFPSSAFLSFMSRGSSYTGSARWYLYGCVFFFKQKTAYEMRISDWSSDVCSSDLSLRGLSPEQVRHRAEREDAGRRPAQHGQAAVARPARFEQRRARPGGGPAALPCRPAAWRHRRPAQIPPDRPVPPA